MSNEILSHLRVQDLASETVEKQAALYGYTAMLLRGKHFHASYSLLYIHSVIGTAIRQKRIKFYFNENGSPVGYVVWAFLVPEVVQRVCHTATYRLHESEWTEGTMLYVVDLVAPLGNLRHILHDIGSMFSVREKEIMYLRRRNGAVVERRLLKHDCGAYGWARAQTVD